MSDDNNDDENIEEEKGDTELADVPEDKIISSAEFR